MKIREYFQLIFCVLICELAGILGSLFTAPAIGDWYSALTKPSLAPPNWVFAPVWTTLFLLMGVSLFLVWKKHSHILENVRMLKRRRLGIGFFVFQLALNTGWSIVFFGFKNPGAAFLEIILLWLAILATVVVFYKISKPAAWLLVPYLLWVAFAGYLNFAIWQMNADGVLPRGPIACTMEAMECPDGSYVGRSGPNCEFAPCPETDVAKELADCLPRSDMESRKKCERLLRFITNYEECVIAGFPIMESYPTQCRTADGRTFLNAI